MGHRRFLLAGVTAFGVVGLGAPLTTDLGLVVPARALQGAAAAVSVPSALRILLSVAAGTAALLAAATAAALAVRARSARRGTASAG